MYDPTPGKYWFGKKWYYIKTEDVPLCPDDLTNPSPTGTNSFFNDRGEAEPDLKIECIG